MSVAIVSNFTSALPTIFSFTNALYSATEDVFDGSNNDPSGHPLELYRHGCLIGEEDVWNCTQACQDVNQIFSSTYTLQNCVAFPRISALLAQDSLTEAARTTAIEAGIDAESYSTSATVHQTIAKCLQGWCRENPKCNSVEGGTQWCYDDIYGKPYCFSDPCSSTDYLVNPEIGGTGVTVNHVIGVRAY